MSLDLKTLIKKKKKLGCVGILDVTHSRRLMLLSAGQRKESKSEDGEVDKDSEEAKLK